MKRIILYLSLFSLSISIDAQSTNDTIQLNNVVVTGARYETTSRNLPLPITSINRDKLTENQRTNVLTTLTEQVPSLFVTSRGMLGYGVSGGAAGGINIRGTSSGSGQILVLIDGHPQYQGIYGHSISDSYQTMMTEKVEVLRGPSSVLYGSNAMGGVINIVTRSTKEDGIKTYLHAGAGSWGTVQTELSNQIRSGKFNSTIAVQYERSDNHRPRMGFELYGGNLKLGYDLSNNWNVFANLNMIHFSASHPGTVEVPMFEADQWITRGLATLGIENHYAKTNGRISVYDNFGIHKINDGYTEGNKPQTEFFRSKDALVGISWYQTMNMLKGNSMTVGIDYQHIYGRAYYTSRESGEVVTDGKRKMQSGHAHTNEIGAYIDVRQDMASWLSLYGGVRFDHHSVAGGEWIPQLGAVISPCKTGEIKAMVSKGFRNPTTKDMYLYAVANHDSLYAERLWNYELSWKQRLINGNLSYGINIFMMRGDNLIQSVAGRNINTGKIKNLGAELEATWHANRHWSFNTNHSVLNMRYHIVGTPEYKGYFGAKASYGRWSVSAGLLQLCGLFTEVGTNEHKENATLLNATINYHVCKQLQLWIKGDNLLAQRYELNAGYPMPRATLMGGFNLTL